MTDASGPAHRSRELSATEILATLERLRDRIADRFPGSGLGQLSGEVLERSQGIIASQEELRRPHWPIRAGAWIALAVMVIVLITALVTVRVPGEVSGVAEFMQGVEASISTLVFLGATAFFLVSLETRIKRRRALTVIHHLRSLAHIVDMHQLTKDPDLLMNPRPATPHSPVRTMQAPDLGRYLDYCSELLSLISKVAALLAQGLNDPVVLNGVNDIENLTSGLSGKIWQKITLLERAKVAG